MEVTTLNTKSNLPLSFGEFVKYMQEKYMYQPMYHDKTRYMMQHDIHDFAHRMYDAGKISMEMVPDIKEFFEKHLIVQ